MTNFKLQITNKLQFSKFKNLLFGILILFVIWNFGFGTYSPVFAYEGLVPCNGPDCEISHLFIMLQKIISWMLLYGGIIAALFIAFGGISMLLARGNEQKITQAKLWITNAVIGILLVFCAWLIINTIMTVIFNRPNWNII